MKTRAMMAGLAALLAILSAGCGGGSKSDTDVSRIKGRFRVMQRGFENKDIQMVMSVFSYDFYDNGVTFDDVKNGVADLFLDFNHITEEQQFRRISVQGDYAYVDWTETLTAQDAYTGEWKQSVTDFYDVLHWEYGDWYLYGNQRDAGLTTQKATRYNAKRMHMAPGMKR